MNLYGNGPGSKVIIVNPNDKDRVEPEKWGGTLVETVWQDEGSVTFGRARFNANVDVAVDKKDPTVVHMTILGQILQVCAVADITEGGLIFTFKCKENSEEGESR
ncbi:MAG: hypothetical protein U9Q07_03860 [Planctomycetota bacterium]|nr:hypothetical protein [Planctomycetota bacterium]